MNVISYSRPRFEGGWHFKRKHDAQPEPQPDGQKGVSKKKVFLGGLIGGAALGHGMIHLLELLLLPLFHAGSVHVYKNSVDTYAETRELLQDVAEHQPADMDIRFEDDCVIISKKAKQCIPSSTPSTDAQNP